MDDLLDRADSRYMKRPAKVRMEAQSSGGLRVSMPRLLGALPTGVRRPTALVHFKNFLYMLDTSGNFHRQITAI